MKWVQRAVVIVALLAATTVVVVRVTDGSADKGEFRWLALGDSYSSGLGEVARAQDCSREVSASYVGRAADILRDEGYRVAPQLAACAGATLDDVFVAQSPTTLAQLEFVDPTVDVVTLTLGGNDVGFGSVVSMCVLSRLGALSSALGVDANTQRECVIDPNNPTNRGNGEDGWQGLEDELVTAYAAVLEKMSPTGTLFVLSYPLMFANPASWPGAACFGFTPDNARSFNVGVLRVGGAVARAVGRAAGSTTRVRFVDWREQESEQDPWSAHGLCGDEKPWVHGIRVLEPGGLTTSPANSFHPTAAGYAHVAELSSDAIDDALKK
jgi:lysophospholipase L1-like esterase